MRYIESDDNLSLRGAALKEAIEDDIKLGLIPFWVSSSVARVRYSCTTISVESIIMPANLLTIEPI